ncbi:MAG: NnrS family protein, partial [Spirochaetaceae bacterium]|nr:NnrS family protein [Spirochaetaceae bacterium]
AANGVIHAEALGLASATARPGLRFAVDLVVVLILVIGGRITPAFTRNALRQRGLTSVVHGWPWLDVLTIGTAATAAASGLIVGRTPVTGLLGMLAGLLAAFRLAGWQSWQTRSDPLLWSLHAGSLWVVVGLFLAGASDLGLPIPSTAGLHALTAGAIGGTIIAVVTRVGLGHTGRSLELPVGAVWCYALVHGAALARVAAPFVAGDGHRALLLASGLAWASAFGLFTIRFWPILTTPRPDGRPG